MTRSGERRCRLAVQGDLGRDHRTARPLPGEQLVDRAVLGVDDEPVDQALAEARDALLDEREGARLEAAVDASGDGVLQRPVAGNVEIGPVALQVVARVLVHRVLVQVEHGGAGVDSNGVQDEGGDRGGLGAGGCFGAAQEVVAVRDALAAGAVAEVTGVAPGIQQREQQDALAPAELRQPARVSGERDRPRRLAAVDAADQDVIDARGVEVGGDRQRLAGLRDLRGDLDPPPAGGEQGVARAVDVRDRRPAVADAGHGVVLVGAKRHAVIICRRGRGIMGISSARTAGHRQTGDTP